MGNLSDNLIAEIENLDKLINELKNYKKFKELNILEIAGIGSFLLNFYTGIENVLKLIFKEYNYTVPKGDSWHKTLLTESVKNKIINKSLQSSLEKYLAFRHFFIHSYSNKLNEVLLQPLVDNIFITYESFKKEMDKYL